MFSNIVVVKAKVKRLSLQRGILSLILHGEKIDLDTLQVLFQNQLWLQSKCLSDEVFQKKYGFLVLEINKILKSTNLSRGLTDGAIGSLKIKLLGIKENLYPERNISQVSNLVRNAFYTKPYKPLGKDTKFLPPKRFIGIGYRDKGTARKSEKDGSPSWQEIASHVSFLENRIEEILDELQKNTGQSFRERRIKHKELLQLIKKLERARASVSNSLDAKAINS